LRIQAAVLEKPDGALTRRTIRIEAVELDDPHDDQVMVRVTSCGVCGTDRGCLHGLNAIRIPGFSGTRGPASSRLSARVSAV
jgi:aryl-alcohol dehydrogenase